MSCVLYKQSTKNVAIYIPPKQSQALLQGGTFVLRNQRALYAHYDPSTAAHAPIQTVLDIALKQ